MIERLKALLASEVLKTFWGRLKSRLTPFGDLSAWVLVAVAAVPLAYFASGMLVTLAQWVVFGLALGGVAILLSRVTLPQIKLNEWLARAAEGQVASAIVVAAILVLLGMIFQGLVAWAKT